MSGDHNQYQRGTVSGTMKKRDKLFKWLNAKSDWVYLREVPHKNFGMSLATASTALNDFCNQGRCEFRVVGLKQYRCKNELL